MSLQEAEEPRYFWERVGGAAAAASIYSTCNMVMRAENNVPCFWSHTSSLVSCFADFYLKIRFPFLPLAFVNCDPLSITVVASDVTRRNLRCMLCPQPTISQAREITHSFHGVQNLQILPFWFGQMVEIVIAILSNVERARSMFWLDDYTSCLVLLLVTQM